MNLALVVISVFSASLAQMALKRAALERRGGFWAQYANPWVLGGYSVLGAALLLNVFCLGHGIQVKEISALEALGYLFVPALARMCFGECLTKWKMVAIGVIMAGVVVFFA